MNEYAENDLYPTLNLKDKGKLLSFDELIHFVTSHYITTYFNDTGYIKNSTVGTIDFESLTERKPHIFFEFGCNLIMQGITPDLLEISVQNAYETIVNYSSKEELTTLRLHLLFVKKSIMLFSQCKYEAYFTLINGLVSKNFNSFQYENFFKDWKK